MLSSQFIHLLALGDQLRAQLVLLLSIDLILLSQLLEDLTEVAPAQPQQLSELLIDIVALRWV